MVLLLVATVSGLQNWSLIVTIIGGVFIAISSVWKGIPAVWGVIKKMRAKHQEALAKRIVEAVQPMFEASNKLLDDHMLREETEIKERNRLTAVRDQLFTDQLVSLGQGLAGIAGALGVNLRDYESTAPKNEKR